MLKVLLQQKLLSVGAWLTGATRKRKTQSKASAIGFFLIMLYAFGSIAFLYYNLPSVLAEPFRAAGIGWLYFAFVSVMCFGMMFIGSVFSAKSQLFEAKDNDLLLSLPVKSSDILLSRLFLLAVIDLAMGLLVMVPAALVWIQNGGFDGAGLLFFVLSLFLIMLTALSVAALFGWLLSLVTARLPGNRTLSTVIFSLLFLGAYMYLISNMNQMIFRLAEDPEPAMRTLGSIAPLVWLGHAMAEGNVPAMLKSMLLPLFSFAVMYVLLSRSFIRTVTTKASRKKIQYRGNTEGLLSVNRTLLRREWNRLTTSSAYLLNSCFGNIIAPDQEKRAAAPAAGARPQSSSARSLSAQRGRHRRHDHADRTVGLPGREESLDRPFHARFHTGPAPCKAAAALPDRHGHSASASHRDASRPAAGTSDGAGSGNTAHRDGVLLRGGRPVVGHPPSESRLDY